MDRTGTDGNHNVKNRSVGIQIEPEEDSTSLEQKTHVADSVLKCLSPLIISVRLLGLYFSRRKLASPTAINEHDPKCIIGCRDWSHARVYATIMLAVTWINATRNCILIDGTETVGDLFTKLGTISSLLLTAFLHTTYYVANHTGSLNRVLRHVDFSKPDFHKKYGRRVKIVTVVCWLLAATGIICYICITFARDYFNDLFLMFVMRTFRLSTQHVGIYIVKAVYVVLQLPSIAIWAFTQAIN